MSALWILFKCLPYVLFVLTMLMFVLRCRFGVRGQAIWSMVLLICFSKFLVYSELGGDAIVPWMPEGVIWFWNWGYSGACILFLLGALTFFWRFPRKGLVLPLLAWGLAACGIRNGVKIPEVREVELAFPDLPPELDGYRIVQVSDIHASTAARRWRTEAIVRRVNEQKPDLICLTGDMTDVGPARHWRYLEPLKDLRAHDGVWAVAGNHELEHEFDAWLKWYELWGVHFLRNRCAVPCPGLVLGGVDDVVFDGRDELPPVNPHVGAAFASATNGEFRVLLQHRPSGALENAANNGVRLQLSGHTHGGLFPGMSAIIKAWNRGYVKGAYDLPLQGRLYVSPGVGQWAGFPIRFFDDPEITVITLSPTAPPAGFTALRVSCPVPSSGLHPGE